MDGGMKYPDKLYISESTYCIYEKIHIDGCFAEALVASFNRTPYGLEMGRKLIEIYNKELYVKTEPELKIPTQAG